MFTFFPDRQWKNTEISSRNTADCVVLKNLKRDDRDHGKELFEAVLSEKVHVNIAANDTLSSNAHPKKLCAACKAKLYRLISLNEEDEAVVHM